MWGRISAEILASIIILVASSSFIETSFATPYIGPVPTSTSVTFYFHNISKSIYLDSTPALNILNTVNDANVTYLKTGKLVTGLHYISVQFYIVPQLASNLTINGTPEVYIYLNQTGSSSGGSISYSLLLNVSQWFHIYYRYISSIYILYNTAFLNPNSGIRIYHKAH